MAERADRRFGELPLPQTVAAAAAIRRLIGMLLSLEHPHPTVDAMLEQIGRWESDLAPALPTDPQPRMTGDSDDNRLYLQHAFAVGEFNPVFPIYRFDDIGPDAARGAVSFPLVYEGPPGLVHGGVLSAFFDCVIQHHSCAVGIAGKTRELAITYRRPTPLDTELAFDIERIHDERGITATARLTRDGEVLCTAVADTVALPPERLAASRFGHRRPG
ncbi:PaaI family thioesterase [Mycobacterium sp. M26]|uniref:PaaI family thioesterase n=1 Tax=Mycobacterium sp. M26 TaxID=1762962 RepID=UPI00073E6A9C|nr:PaaI family thioesterase [Mycobacterium sp. M26]